MSLSEYVEAIVENRETQNQYTQPSQVNDSEATIWQLKSQVKELTRKLSFFYEEPIMKRTFLNNQGKIISYTDKDGIPRKDAITSIEEVYKILFKTNNLS